VLGEDVLEGRGTAAFRAAVDEYIVRFRAEGSPPRAVQAERDYYDNFAFLADGNFDGALAALEKVAAFYAPEHMEVDIAYVWDEKIRLLEELGRSDEAAALAQRWLRERETWIPSAYLNSRIKPLASLYRLGRLSRPAFVAERAAWDAETSTKSFDTLLSVWLFAYGEALRTSEDASTALAISPRFAPFPPPRAGMEVDAALGEVLFRAGRSAEAVPRLRAAIACDPTEGVLFYVRAFARLGDALADLGERSEACAAYARVLRLWNPASGSITARDAQRERQRLRCD
jgi:tetratricopeptide (TPR) repeat protein